MKIENCKLKIISICLLAYWSIGLFPQPALAEGISLSLSPPLTQVRLNPSSNNHPQLTLKNQGNDPLNIEVLFKPFQSHGESGQIEYTSEDQITNDYKDILSKVKLTDEGKVTSDFQLGPKQKKILKLEFDIPKNQKPSDYYFSVVFLAHRSASEGGLTPNGAIGEVGHSLQPQTKAYSRLNAGVASNIMLSIGNEKPTGYIEEFSTSPYVESGPVAFTLRVKNSGQQFIKPRGIILIKNIFGQIIGRLDLTPANILSGSIRSLTNKQTENISVKSSSSDHDLLYPKIIWPEKFLLGAYTANLKLALSDQGPLYNRSIVFVALPFNFVLGTIALLIILTITIIRVKDRLRMEK